MHHRRPRLPGGGAARVAPSPWIGAALLVLCAALAQSELYKPGALTTIFYLLVFLLLGTPWLFLVVR
jgi:hypothetical protein